MGQIMFDRSKAKNRVFDYQKMNMFVEHCLSPFDVRKNDVRVCSMNDLVNLVKAFKVQCSMSIYLMPKFRCSRSIITT